MESTSSSTSPSAWISNLSDANVISLLMNLGSRANQDDRGPTYKFAGKPIIMDNNTRKNEQVKTVQVDDRLRRMVPRNHSTETRRSGLSRPRRITHRSGSAAAAAARVMHPRIRGRERLGTGSSRLTAAVAPTSATRMMAEGKEPESPSSPGAPGRHGFASCSAMS
jgi:hypothetical protein